jgi:hypothetical protein
VAYPSQRPPKWHITAFAWNAGRRFGFSGLEAEPFCVMASKSQDLFSEIEQAQVDLRESIEHSRRLVERSEALIRQVKDQAPDPQAEPPPAEA